MTDRAEPMTPRTRAGRLLLGKNAGSDRDPAWVEWLLNDILAKEHERLRAAVEAGALDVGIYPASSPDGKRTPWQDGWNAAAIAIGDALDALLKEP